MIRFVFWVRQFWIREERWVGKSGKSWRTGGHSDQYSGCTSTINKAVLEASNGGQWW